MWKPITRCRLCQTPGLTLVLSLNSQAFTGIFPKSGDSDIPKTPVELVKCEECHLVQLAHSYDMSYLYGMSYGYRSGLNQSMVKHLVRRVDMVRSLVPLASGDLVVDIGSNDGTLLSMYPDSIRRIGIDPSGAKFRHFYAPGVELIPNFFSAEAVKKVAGDKKPKVITSIAMFYDLENPQSFVEEIASLLAPDGVWVFEQSYLPAMLETNSYDTICHEHLEYYALSQVVRLLKNANLKIVQLEFNDVNGGSFAITAAHMSSSHPEAKEQISDVLKREHQLGLHTFAPYQRLQEKMGVLKHELRAYLSHLKSQGETVLGYGASTKGNVMLQFCEMSAEDLPFIAEVNEDKFGARTPGTNIPIISEKEAHAMRPDYFVVLPWHFREGIVEREQAFLEAGGKFIFAFPEIEVVSSKGCERASTLMTSLLIEQKPKASRSVKIEA